MKLFMILTALILFSFKSVYAMNPAEKLQAQQTVCYGREYSHKHMDKHPKQSVKRMRIKLHQNPKHPDSTYMSIDLSLKKEIKNDGNPYTQFVDYKSNMYCYEVNNQEIKCSIDCDGGSAQLTWNQKQNPDGSLMFYNNGFVIYGGCGHMDETSGEPSPGEWLDKVAGGDDVFKLYPLPSEFCEV